MLTALRCEAIGVPASGRVSTANIVLEATGEFALEKWFSLNEYDPGTPLAVEIYAEASGLSLPLQGTAGGISGRKLTNASIVWMIPPRQPDLTVSSPDLAGLFPELQVAEGWKEDSALTVVLRPLNGTESGVKEQSFKGLLTTGGSLSRRGHWTIMQCIVIPLMAWQLRRGGRLFELSGGALSPAPGGARLGCGGRTMAFGWVGIIGVLSFLNVIAFGGFGVAQVANGEWIVGLLFVLSAVAIPCALFGLAAWLLSFALTCELSAAAIKAAAAALAEPGAAFDRTSAMATAVACDTVGDELNDGWEKAQLALFMFIGIDLYQSVRDVVLVEDAEWGSIFPVMFILLDCALLLGLLVPPARVTAAYDELSDALLDVQARAEAAGDVGTVAGCETILQYLERRRVGYKILETFPISYYTIRRCVFPSRLAAPCPFCSHLA
jgi:hypothetical protein